LHPKQAFWQNKDFLGKVKFQPKYADIYTEGSAMQVATPFFYGVNTMRVVSNEACEALLHCHSLFFMGRAC